MSGITGLGGVFLYATDAQKLLKWYHDVLGLNVSRYGVNFLAPNQFTLITFDRAVAEKAGLNFTVDDLEDFITALKCRRVKVVKDVTTCEYGKFAQIEDLLGNTVELWEPFEEPYKRMVEAETAEYRCATE